MSLNNINYTTEFVENYFTPKHQNQFVNKTINDLLPFASCPLGSLDVKLNSDWYIDDLKGRLIAAAGINDILTFNQISKRLLIHMVYQHTSDAQCDIRKKAIEFILSN